MFFQLLQVTQHERQTKFFRYGPILFRVRAIRFFRQHRAAGDRSLCHARYFVYPSKHLADDYRFDNASAVRLISPLAITAMSNDSLIEQINLRLPQTQCGQCGFKGCRPYAEAIAAGYADIDRCPPGGDDGVAELAQLLGFTPKPLNSAYGRHKAPQVAFIVEAACIGCVKCLAACPVDAIVGAAKFMHTVIADECTGCELCVAPCPVDCITMQPKASEGYDQRQKSAWARRRYEARCARKAFEAAQKAARLRQKVAVLTTHY